VLDKGQKGQEKKKAQKVQDKEIGLQTQVKKVQDKEIGLQTQVKKKE